MKVVILAGGRGTRLGEETAAIPKPMVEIGGRPILWHIMRLYAHFGLTDFVVCLGYKGHVIKAYFASYMLHRSDVTIHLGANRIDYHNHTGENWRVTLAETGAATETGGRLRAVAPYLSAGEPFCMTYGDGLGDIDIARAVAFHRAHGRLASVTAVRPPPRFGASHLAGDVVTKFTDAADRGLDQWRLLRAVARRARSDRGRRDGVRAGAVAASGARRAACGVPPRRVLAADGHVAGEVGPECPWDTGAAPWKLWE